MLAEQCLLGCDVRIFASKQYDFLQSLLCRATPVYLQPSCCAPHVHLRAGGLGIRIKKTNLNSLLLNQRHSCSSYACCVQEAGLCEQQHVPDLKT